MRENTIKTLLGSFLPETAYEVSKNGWYYYESLGFYKTEEEALASVKMTKEEYLKQREAYEKSHGDYETVIHIDMISPKEYLQKYYDELIKEIKNETIKNEAMHIRDAAKEEINFAVKIQTRRQIEDFLKHMLYYANEEYGATPD